VLHVAQRLLEMGCYEVSLGDTIGTGEAGSTHKLLETVLKSIPADKLAVHFHDTYGQVSGRGLRIRGVVWLPCQHVVPTSLRWNF
jgi:pyruvate/oxaloacetate carboxyltransferase